MADLERFKPSLGLELHLPNQLSFHKRHGPISESGDSELVRAFGHRPRLPPPIVLVELFLEPRGAFLETADVGEGVERFDRRD